jgi:SAM domain (Sterile alpha motif)
MQQIVEWLKQLGMSEYAQRFVESDIDTSVLRDLTDQDLKELGVSLGHRRKMLRAIAELASAAPTSPQPTLTEPKTQDTAERRQAAGVVAATTPPSSAAAEVVGERRYLTVMFCGRLNQHFRLARRGGVARSRRLLLGRRLNGGHGDGWSCRQEAWRRADGLVRLSGGAGERRRTRSAGCALDPARARRGEPQECCWQASAERTHWD